MKVFNITLPSDDICNKTELYYHSDTFLKQENELLYIPSGCCVKFSTYFNSFSLDKYKKYTRISDLQLIFTLKGSAIIKVFCADKNSESEVYSENVLSTNTAIRISIKELENLNGILYFTVEALMDCVFSNGYFETSSQPNNIKIGAVICTFKREDFVYRNMARISGFDFKNKLEIFIIDNGKTIVKEKINSNIVTIFENKNYGGSGGFTRGLIEVHRKKNNFTHVLLMDDDIVFDCNAIFKTISFLELLKPEYKNLWISGSMLILDMPYMQYEAGALFKNNKVISLKDDINLCEFKNVVNNETNDVIIQYGAWWYMCMPINIIKRQNLPLPLFIRNDDIEYGVRSDDEIITLNGISVWHEYFAIKYNFYIEYYIIRNSLITSSIHFPSYIDVIRMMFWNFSKALITYRYNTVNFIYKALDDFLKGPDFLLKSDEEIINNEIKAMAPKLLNDEELWEKYKIKFNADIYDKQINEALFKKKKYLHFFSFNGYFIPKIFFKKDMNVTSIAEVKPINFYRYKNVLQYNINENKGIVTSIKKSEFFKIGFKFMKYCIIFLFKYKNISSLYRRRYKELTSMDFWCNHLEIENPDI